MFRLIQKFLAYGGKPKQDSPLQLIMTPLMVMLLLTILMGFSTYSLTQSWGQTIDRIGQRMTDTVILNNIRWQAYQAQQLIDKNPADVTPQAQQQAKQLWIAISWQLRNLSPAFTRSDNGQVYLNLLRQPMTPVVLHQMFTQDVLKKQLDDNQQELMTLQKDAQGATVILTLSMSCLGLLLMIITTRELGKLIAQLKQSRDLAVAVQEDERRRIAQDIHDGVIQDLIVLRRQCQSGVNPEVQVDYMIHELRRICQNLKPQMLEDLGLESSLENLIQDLRQQTFAQVTLDLTSLKSVTIPKTMELQLFRVFQELVSNIKRHSQAKSVTISVHADPANKTLTGLISDDGIGFDPHQSSSAGMGLTGVSERVAQMGGWLDVKTSPGHGSCFEFQIPLSPVSYRQKSAASLI